MNTKYGLNFEVSGNPVFNSQGSVWFSANVAVSGQPSQDAAARVTATGNLVDNFAQNLYKDQIESAHRQVCESKSFVAPCTVDINMPATSEKWDSSAPLEQFISESGVANDVRVTLVHADTDGLCTTDILDLINGLYATTPSFHLFVKIGETSVFGWNSIQLHGQDKVPTRTQVLQSLAGLTGN
jgi:hypothetical protein